MAEFTDKEITEGIKKGTESFLENFNGDGNLAPILRKAIENTVENWLADNSDEIMDRIAKAVAEKSDF